MRSIGMMGVVAAMAMSSALTAHPLDEVLERPSQKRRTSRQPTKGNTYEPKTPETAHDFARLEAAERKRARKAAKLRDTTEPAVSPGMKN